jgi:DNA-binding NarL/FixJ family response regulator
MSSLPPATTALLVDDEAYFRRFVGRLLVEHGVARVLEARDGCEAVELYAALRPDLVILDINMPRMDGIEALQALRRIAPEARIIMLTSIADERMVERCVEEGATYFLRKDVPAHELAAELRAVLAPGDAGQELSA